MKRNDLIALLMVLHSKYEGPMPETEDEAASVIWHRYFPVSRGEKKEKNPPSAGMACGNFQNSSMRWRN